MHSDASKRFSCFIGLRATGKQLVLECVNNWWWIGFSIWQSIVVVSDRRAWRSQHTHTHTHKWLWEKLLCGLCVSISTKSASHHMKLRKEIVLVWFQMCSTWLLVGLYVSGVEIVFFLCFYFSLMVDCFRAHSSTFPNAIKNQLTKLTVRFYCEIISTFGWRSEQKKYITNICNDTRLTGIFPQWILLSVHRLWPRERLKIIMLISVDKFALPTQGK